MAKNDETEEEAPESGQEEAGEEELTAEDAESMLYDSEVLIRAGVEKLDILFETGFVDQELRDKADALWNAVLAKINEGE